MSSLTLINHDTKLSDIVIAEPSALTVLNRFGIRLGLGDLTVARACIQLDIDPDFMVTILNPYLNEAYFPERIEATFKASTIVNYLGQTNNYYIHFHLPVIERHFGLLISKSDPANNNLGLMLKFFTEVKQQLLDRIADDRDRWFPAILEAEATATAIETFIRPDEGDVDTVEDKLTDLINMMVIHLSGNYDGNLALAVLMALVSLKNDLVQNNRIRNRLLRPMFHVLIGQ